MMVLRAPVIFAAIILDPPMMSARVFFGFFALAIVVFGAPVWALPRPTPLCLLNLQLSDGHEAADSTLVIEVYRRLLIESGADLIRFEKISNPGDDVFDLPMSESSSAIPLKKGLESLRGFVSLQNEATRAKILTALREELDKLVNRHDSHETERGREVRRKKLLPAIISKLKNRTLANPRAITVDQSGQVPRILVSNITGGELEVTEITSEQMEKIPTFGNSYYWAQAAHGDLFWGEDGVGIKVASLSDLSNQKVLLRNKFHFVSHALEPDIGRLAVLYREGEQGFVRPPDVHRAGDSSHYILLTDYVTGSISEIPLPKEFNPSTTTIAMTFVPGTPWLILVADQNQTLLIDTSDVRAPLRQLPMSKFFIPSKISNFLKASPDRRFFVVNDQMHALQQVFFDVHDVQKTIIRRLPHNFRPELVSGISISRDSKLIVALWRDGHFVVWDAESGQVKAESALMIPGEEERFVDFVSDSEIVTVSNGGTIHKVNVRALVEEQSQ